MERKTVWIIGAGGLGIAIANAYQRQQRDVWLISSKTQNLPGVNHVLLDHLDEIAITRFVTSQLSPDELVISAGLLHDEAHQPEKTLLQLERDWLLQSMEANVLPTIQWCKCLTQTLQKNTRLKVASFSARVSSVSDNRLGGWHSYRMSKAALNMLIKNIAIEWHMTYPNACIIGYHPGTVDTRLSKPFQTNVKKDALFSPEQAANYFMSVFSSKGPNDRGMLFDWQSKVIPY